jgi:hypothetical protein
MKATTWNWRAEYDANVRELLASQAGVHPLGRKACRKLVREEMEELPRWARGAEPGVVLLRPAEITAAALKAHCRLCGKCSDMPD